MFDGIKSDTGLPQDTLHDCAAELTLLGDLFSAVREADLALSANAIVALTRKLSACASAIEAVAWQITPGGKPMRA
jgi:hypothetical protein